MQVIRIVALWVCQSLERIATGLKRYWRVLATVCVTLGVLTVLPWGASRPNHVSYYSVCSFAPFSTVTLFVMAATFYSFGKGMKRLCYLGMIALITIGSFSAYWAYSIKLPVDSLQVNMLIDYFWYGYDDFYEDNVSSIFFSLTFTNPTGQDTPPLRIEDYNFFINGKKLLTFISHSGGWNRGIRYITSPLTIKAHQTSTYSEIHIILGENYTKIEGNDTESLWASLMQGNFKVTLTGILVERNDFGNEDRSPSTLIIVARPLTLSCTYQS